MATQSNIQYVPKSARLNSTRDGSSITRQYTMFGWDTEGDAGVAFHNWLNASSLLTLVSPLGAIAPLDTFDLEQVGDDFIHDPSVADGAGDTDPPNYGTTRGAGIWSVTCKWSTMVGKTSSIDDPALGERTYSMSIDNRSTHVDFSLETLERIDVGSETEDSGYDHGGAINVLHGKDDKLDIKGVDIPDNADVMYTIERTYDHNTLSKADVIAASAYRNTMNASDWEGFAAGEMAFLGMDFTFHAETGEERVNWSFGINANDPDFRPLGYSGDRTIAKLGWDYFWTYYREEIEQTAQIPFLPQQRLVLRPQSWYIERVMEFSAWDATSGLISIINK